MLISEEDGKKLADRFSTDMEEEVELIVIFSEEENDEINRFTVGFMEELAGLSDKIRVTKEAFGGDLTKEHDVKTAPTILIAPDRYHLRYSGAPAGEEAWGFLETIVLASTGRSGLEDAAKEGLAKLKEKHLIQTFVTLTCPYCPMQALVANKMAVEAPDKISSDVVEAQENPELAMKFKVTAVPFQALDGKLLSVGVQREDKYVADILKAEEEAE